MEEADGQVLIACEDAASEPSGAVHDADIARHTRMPISDVRDYLESLEFAGLVERVRVENPDGFRVLITAKGRIELGKLRFSRGNSKEKQSESTAIKIVPKGLRSFDEHDKDFFLELLPGPRRGDGLPESVDFWKVRIEETDLHKTFRAGVIYGASGCGKSSLVKAGLLPKLTDHVRHVYVEATADRTESDLLTGVRIRYPGLSPGLGLVESLAALQNQTALPSGEKFLLVLDQFEQWLLEHRGEEEPTLIKALRHCDGQVGKALLMVRDDFLAATIRFMKEIGVEFRPDHNACEVELFKPRHAERVLTAFGRAEEILGDDLATEQQKFITQSVRSLARSGGLVIPVRLAIFFQTVKNQEWNSKTLRKLGDAEGVGAAFLEKTFNDEYANRRHRDHQEAAQLVLGALLPESGRDIKRPSRAKRELLEVSGYLSEPERFDGLIRILDEELRLITAIDRDTIVVAGSPAPTTGDRFYQLTHDFLVPSLREWRSNKDQEASKLVESIWMAETKDVPLLLSRLEPLRFWANPLLRRIMENSGFDSKERLHASLALLPVDHEQVEFLYSRLLVAGPNELPALRDALRSFRERLIERLWNILEQSDTKSQWLRAGSALALYDPSNPRWDTIGSKVAQAMVTGNAAHLGSWLDVLRPVRDKLTPPLATIFRNRDRSPNESALAFDILEDYASDQLSVLSNLLLDSDKDHFTVLFEKLRTHQDAVVALLEAEMIRSLPEATEVEKDGLAKRQARASVALVRMGKSDETWPRLRHSTDPRHRSFIVNLLAPLGADPRTLVAELDRLPVTAKPTSAQGQQFMEAVLFHPETSQRRALILALGTYEPEELSLGEREPLVDKLLDLYRNDPDSGIHGAAEWTLGQWKNEEKLKGIDAELSRLKERGDRRWFVNSQGQTFAVIEGPVEFDMGSPPTEPDRDSDEIPHRVVIPRRFAIAVKEVSKQQWQPFVKQHPEWALDATQINRFSPDPEGPMVGFSWFAAAAFCNWMSEQESLPKDQWCYVPAEGNAYKEGMTIPADVLERRGYRLPTAAEWEYACRAGAVTSRYYGNSIDLLEAYARYTANSNYHAWKCGSLRPNDLGLFDTLGNVNEWVQDEYQAYHAGVAEAVSRDIVTSLYINETPRLLRGGSFLDRPAIVRSANRLWLPPANRVVPNLGFRPSRTYQ